MTNNQFKRVEKWLQEFNPGLSIDANGTSYIATNDGMDIVLSVVEDGSGIVFFSPNFPFLLWRFSRKVDVETHRQPSTVDTL